VNIRRLSSTAFAAAALGLCASRASAATCESLTGLPLAQVTIRSAVPTTAGALSYCRVVGAATPTARSNVGFEVWLPLSGWNGKFQGVGSGGSAGSISTGALQAAVARHYAAMATDNGHLGGSWTFAHTPTGDPERVTDFGWRAEHVSTVAAKAIVRAFYGVAPAHSYFVGCSQGGHHALMEAQRFPEDYDGIIGGDPANSWNRLMLGELWTGVVSGLRNPANELPQAKLDVLMNALLLACDGNDGIVDGVVEDPRTCNFDPSVVRCPGGADAVGCLSDGQLQAVRDIYAGAKNPVTHEQLFPGFAHSSENALRQVLVGTTSGGVRIPGGSSNSFFREGIFANPAWNPGTFDFSLEPSRTNNTPAGTETWGAALNATDPDLRPLQRRGAKLIMYHGWSDPFITPYNSIQYYESVAATVSRKKSREDALKETAKFARLFMVPGMWHCAGGPGPNTFDMLTALETWVETGKAPKSVVGTKYVGDNPANAVVLQRPLCAYPTVATYDRKGDPTAAASFNCKKPHDDHGGDDGDRDDDDD
jgi:feruloyl esterase